MDAMLIIILGFIATAGFVWAFRNLAIRYHFLDIPNARSSHAFPTPSGGGIGMVISFFMGISLLYFFNLLISKLFIALFFGGFLLASIGFLDDICPVPARIRILIHLIAAAGVLRIFNGMPSLDLGFIVWHWQGLGIIVGLLGLVWLINFYNFMDGIDGLAASEAIFVSMAVILLLCLKNHYQLIPVLALFMATVAGFLIWNWPPARIFMGDAGSGFLGFILGVLLIASLTQGILAWQWLILLGCFWVDATLTLILRIMRKEPWYQAHCSHAFQQAVKKMGCHKRVVTAVLMINLGWLLPIAILSLYFPKWVLLLTFIAIIPLIILCLFLKAGISSRQDEYSLSVLSS